MKKLVLAAALTGALSGTAFAQAATTAPAGTAHLSLSFSVPAGQGGRLVSVNGCRPTGACMPQLKGSVSVPFNVAGPVTAYDDRGNVLLVTVLGVRYMVSPAFVNLTLNGIAQTVASHQSLLGANCNAIGNTENTLESTNTRIELTSNPKLVAMTCTK